MRAIWEDVAQATHRDRGQIEQEAASAWLLQELREIDQAIVAYLRRYHVTAPDELERAIRDGKEDDHPTWEDKLAWDNLLAYRDRLLTALAAVSARNEVR
jgi:hypothetical protein